MSQVQPENGAPERVGKVIGTILAGLVVLAVLVVMVRQFV